MMPCNLCEIKPCTKPGAYTIALEGSSWCGWDSMFYNGCICNWGKIIFFILLILILILLYYYWYKL